MLSLILKAILNNKDSKFEVSVDTEISLSMIESGCLFANIDEQTALIIKCPPEDINALKNINKINIDFDLIERPEFPSLAMHIQINTAANNPYVFDYFFNTESPSELDVLSNIAEQSYFDMHFYTSEFVHTKKVELGDNDKSELRSLIQRVHT